MDKLLQLWQTTGIYHMAWGQAVMIVVCFGLIYLAIRKGFEPLLLIPIGFGGILANLPVANMEQICRSTAASEAADSAQAVREGTTACSRCNPRLRRQL